MIDFTSQSLDLVYLVEIGYHYQGEAYKAHWCGPPDRCGGGGLVVPHPDSGGPVQWESRLTGGRIDRDLGGLLEGLARVASASFTVAAGGPDSAELRKRVRDGRWVNRACTIWLLDRDTGATQHAGTGVVSREPSAWGDASFGLSVRIWPFPDELEWPTGSVPNQVPATWDASNNASEVEIWHPASGQADHYQLNPEHKGRQVGLLFGGTTNFNDPLVVELVPYGVQTQASQHIYCWVSPQELCHVVDAWWESDDGIIRAIDVSPNQEVNAFVNRDPTRGPLGTCVKISMPSAAASQQPRWWSPSVTPTSMAEGANHRVYAWVSGPGWADFPTTYDAVLDPFTTHGGTPAAVPDLVVPAATPPFRGRHDKILEDFESDPILNEFATFYGTNALADFAAAAPTYFVSLFQCRIPLPIADRAPPMREVLAEFMAYLQADLCWRLDPVTDRMALFPIWRGPRPSDVADWTFADADLVRVEQPRAIKWEEDPFRDYGTRVRVRAPERMGQPGDDRVDLRKESAVYASATEEAAGEYGGVLVKDVPRKQWNTLGLVSARNAGEHHCQRQRQSEATHGRRGFRVQQGDLLAYDIGDYPTSIGQVRKTAWDLDAVTATISALHIETFPDDGDKKEGEGQ